MSTGKIQSKAFYALIGFCVVLIGSLLWWLLNPIEEKSYTTILLPLNALALSLWLFFQYQERKRANTLRGMVYGVNAVATFLIALLGIFLVNYLATKHDFKKDLTQNQRQSISPQLKKVVESLQEKVVVKSFIAPDNFNLDAAVRDFMRNLKDYGKDKLEFTPIDIRSQPLEVRAYEITQANTLVIEMGEKGERREKIRIEETDLEEKFANGLIKLTRNSKKKIYFLKGHGERSITDQSTADGLAILKESLEKASFETAELSLLEKSEVPEDASVLVVAGPRKEPLAPEVAAIKTYLTKNGNLLFLADSESPQKWNEVLSDFSVSFSSRIILEPNALAQMAQLSLAHPVVVNFNASSEVAKESKQPLLMYIAADLTLKEDRGPGVETAWLAKTGDRSWAETDLSIGKKEQRVQFDPGKDIKGPLIIAASSVKKVSESVPADPNKPGEEAEKPPAKENRVIVFGDSDFVSNQFFQQLGNPDFSLNSIAWLTNDPDLISIRPKAEDQSKLEISKYAARIMKWGTLLIYPLALLGFAFFLYRRRLAL